MKTGGRGLTESLFCGFETQGTKEETGRLRGSAGQNRWGERDDTMGPWNCHTLLIFLQLFIFWAHE